MLGYVPSDEEIYSAAARDVEEKIRFLKVISQSPRSIDAPAETYDIEHGSIRQYGFDVADDSADQDIVESVNNFVLAEQISKMLQTLSKRQRPVIILRFGLEGMKEHTLEEVGQILGVSKERARQIEARTLKLLRHPQRNKKLRDFLPEERSKKDLNLRGKD